MRAKPLDLALRYMEIFYTGEKIDKLNEILDEDLYFTGPLFKFDSAEDYINSLKKDPPEGMNYEIIKSFEDENSACIIYRFFKGIISTKMVQLFEVKDDKINKIILVFDTKTLMQ